jgi:hypothetical protein
MELGHNETAPNNQEEDKKDYRRYYADELEKYIQRITILNN